MENRNILNPTIKAQSVRSFIIRVISTFALILILGSFVMYFLIFKPLNEALEDSLTENFNQISLVNFNSFDSDLKRGIEGAKSISSRTVIRDELDSYLKGQVSLGDLIDFTQPKFSDGARPLYALILAERVIDDGIIASFSNETTSEITLRPQDIPEKSFEPTIKVNVIGNKAYSVVLSPVILDNKILCYDRLVFDLTQMIRSLNSSTVETYLMDDIDFSTLVNGATVASTNGTTTIYSNNEYHFAT
ncbi:MAG: hypothetical protein RBT15_01795, partial [Gudongella sp.]|nr:hypothetical protein [Gudongella sp.]